MHNQTLASRPSRARELKSLGEAGPACFVGFGIICIFMAFASQKILYETRGKTLEQIENYLHHRANKSG